MNVNPYIFREYDVRGLAEADLTSDLARALGRAFGTYVGGGAAVTVGRDVRLSSPRLNGEFSRGLIESGCQVVELGVVPTPVVYYARVKLNAGGSAVITGSHNPIEYNGFKLAKGELSLYGPEIQELRRTIESGRFASGPGSASVYSIVSDYSRELLGRVQASRGLRIGIDCGNGTTGPVVAGLMRGLGMDAAVLFGEPDGRFPNHLPDPTVPAHVEDLRKLVLREKLEVGIAYDGDGDRIGAIDDTGRIVWGDQLVALFAADVLKKHPGGKIIFDVKCSQGVEEHVRALGGRPLMWKTGHSLMKRKLKEEGGLLAGEMSGHMFFADDYFGYDDAIYASLRLVSLLSGADEPLSAMVDALPRYVSTPEMRLECPEEVKFQLVERLKASFKAEHEVIEIDGARIQFGDGWGLVRASNTQPVLVARFEAKSQERLEEIKSLVLGRLESLRAGVH
ncbi:MAG: phosphomannomutase/phosphoglucomutase [Candidatus Eisenbacteria bacterium]|nr:phosphomannomutase/phosphoglucomutase [Candidatus Eisenbacteria bacterium]